MMSYYRVRTWNFALWFCVFGVMFVLAGCDRVRQIVSTEKNESIEISMESLIDRLVTRDKEAVEEEQKKGHSNAVGFLDGKEWLENNDDKRLAYIVGISDFVQALQTVFVLTFNEVTNQEKTKGLQAQKGQTTYSSLLESQYKLSNRVREVTGGRSRGDIIDAVTKFYQNKPLLRDKAVLWVLAVPLYKELQDATPTDKKSTDNDIVKLWMTRK